VGSWAEAFGRPLSGVITNPVTHDEIRIGLAFGSVLVHPSVIIRTNFYRRCRYDKNCFYAEDYEYWTRAIILGGRFGNVPKVLIRYRQHKSQISSKYRHEQLRISKQISINYFYQIRNEIGISISTFLALIGGREAQQLAHDIHTIRSEVEQFALRGEVFATRILLRAMRSFVFYTECEGVSGVSSWWFSLCKTFNVPVSFYDRIILSIVAFSVMVFPNLGPRYIYRLKKYLIG
jgi:hypothetical protein